MTTHSTHGTPPELRAIESALNDLAAQDRGSAPAGLADRVFAASSMTLNTGGMPSLKLVGAAAPARSPRVVVTWGVRVAAAVALIAGAALIVTVLRPAAETPTSTLAVAPVAAPAVAVPAEGAAAAETLVSVTLSSLAVLEADTFDASFSDALAEADRLAGLVSGEPGDPSELLGNGAL